MGPATETQMKAMFEPGPDSPIFMVNLLKFKEKAEYEDGRETDLTGREAYQIYAEAVGEILKDYNGAPIFAGDVTHLTIGQIDNLWDEVAIARYSCRADMVAMSSSPEWQAAAVHRTAGLAGQLNIETVLPEGMGEGWLIEKA